MTFYEKTLGFWPWDLPRHNIHHGTSSAFSKNVPVMADLKGAPAVHFNLPLLSFYLYTTFKTGIAAAGEPIPSE